MRHKRHAHCFRKCRNFSYFGYAAYLCYTWLCVLHRSGIKHFFKLKSSAGILAGGDWNTALRTKPRQRIEIFRWENRLFEPMQIINLQPIRHNTRLLRCPRTVGVNHQGGSISSRLSGCCYCGDCGFMNFYSVIPIAACFRDILTNQIGFSIFQEAGIARHVRPRRTAHPSAAVYAEPAETREALSSGSAFGVCRLAWSRWPRRPYPPLPHV